MINKRQYILIKIIFSDLLNYCKYPLILLIISLFSALIIIKITYQTRCLIFENEQLLMEEHILNMNWHNLVLEENKLINHNYIKNIAINKFNMQDIDSLKEEILIQP